MIAECLEVFEYRGFSQTALFNTESNPEGRELPQHWDPAAPETIWDRLTSLLRVHCRRKVVRDSPGQTRAAGSRDPIPPMTSTATPSSSQLKRVRVRVATVARAMNSPPRARHVNVVKVRHHLRQIAAFGDTAETNSPRRPGHAPGRCQRAAGSSSREPRCPRFAQGGFRELFLETAMLATGALRCPPDRDGLPGREDN